MRTRRNLREVDRRYIKFKMQQIKQAKQEGNEPLAQRHATELLQYLGVGDSGTPIETVMNETEQIPFRDRITKLYK